jgi:hypothetical protein
MGENSPKDRANEFYYTVQWINGASGIIELFEIGEQAKSKTYETK